MKFNGTQGRVVKIFRLVSKSIYKGNNHLQRRYMSIQVFFEILISKSLVNTPPIHIKHLQTI